MCSAGEDGKDEERIKKPQDAEEAGEVKQEGRTEAGRPGSRNAPRPPYPPASYDPQTGWGQAR